MALQASGAISADDIRKEFGPLSGAVSFGAYRLNGGQTVGTLGSIPLDTGIPTSGSISFENFYSKKLNMVVDLFNINQDSVRRVARSSYNDGFVTVIGGFISIPSNSSGKKVYINVNKRIGSDKGSINNVALQTGSWNSGTELILVIGSGGGLYGAGGDGGSGSTGQGENATQGTSALGIQYSTTLINNGFIFGGRGGGGGGGGATFKRCGKNQKGCKGGSIGSLTGGGGAGGRGFPGGSGGTGGNNGTAGTIDLDGSPGGGVFGQGTEAGYSGTSGAGGSIESPGSGGGSGGSRGYAIIINSGVTLSKSGGTGTISGSEVTGTPT